MARAITSIHGRDHREDGADPAVGPWIYVGTDGVDGVDDQLAANPHPYATGDTPGPPPFQNGWTNLFALDADGNPGDGLRYRWEAGGVKVDCGGGIIGGTNNSIVTTLTVGSVPLPNTTKPGNDGLVDGSGMFVWSLGPTGDLTFLRAFGGLVDGGSA